MANSTSKSRNERDHDITFEVRDHLGVLASKNNGWQKELNIVVWNGKEPGKYDIREWNDEHTKMSRGITLFEDEMKNLVYFYHLFKSQAVVDAARARNEADRIKAEKEADAAEENASAEEPLDDIPDGTIPEESAEEAEMPF